MRKEDLVAYQTLGPDSQEPRCPLSDATDLFNKFSGLTTAVPSLEPVGVYALPPPGNPALGSVTVQQLLDAGADPTDTRYGLVIHLKKDAIPTDERAPGGDPVFNSSRHHWNVPTLVQTFQSGNPDLLRDFFANLAGGPGSGGGGDPLAGAVPYMQFMNQGPIRAAVTAAMTSGLRAVAGSVAVDLGGPHFGGVKKGVEDE